MRDLPGAHFFCGAVKKAILFFKSRAGIAFLHQATDTFSFVDASPHKEINSTKRISAIPFIKVFLLAYFLKNILTSQYCGQLKTYIMPSTKKTSRKGMHEDEKSKSAKSQ